MLLVAAEEILLPPLDEGGGEAVDGRMVLAIVVIVKSESGQAKVRGEGGRSEERGNRQVVVIIVQKVRFSEIVATASELHL